MRCWYVRRSKTGLRRLTVINRRTHRGISVHRGGGASLIGLPHSGGSTIAWGRVRDRIEQLAENTTIVRLGPVLLCWGEDF